MASMRTWLIASAIVAVIAIMGRGVNAQSCNVNCDVSDSYLKVCNSSLGIDTWPSKVVYQPAPNTARCVCNDNFYQQTTNCLTCQSSPTAKYSVMPLPQYKELCTSYGYSTWPLLPQGTGSSTSATTQEGQPAATSLPSDGNNGGPLNHSGLSSGAVAGIVVSAIALLVALSVAGYVYARRKRELARQKEEEDLYKFQENSRNSYMEAPLPQYTGMIQSSLPSLPQLTNLRVMNPDSDDEDNHAQGNPRFHKGNSFEVTRGASPGWRRGSFDDD